MVVVTAFSGSPEPIGAGSTYLRVVRSVEQKMELVVDGGREWAESRGVSEPIALCLSESIEQGG